jgi:tripartite-type tricarboxylate transporter receptor subunit TctC
MACSRAIRALITLWLDAAATAGLCAPSLAQKIDFSGERITLAIATPPGGGYDLYGRLAGRFLGAYLPGNPSVIPQNMPGAGSLIAANWLANVAPRDGTAIGIVPMATAFDNLLGNASARFDARRFNWLVSLNDYTAVVAVWHATPFLTAADLFSKELLVGGSGAASDVTVWPVLLNALIGTRTRTVRGYPGTAGITLAMERGEVQGVLGDDWASLKANKADWLREQKLRILMQLTATPHADLPAVPLAGAFATSEANARVLALFVERQQYGRPFLAPPGTPAPIVAAYREAFAKVAKDPDFIRAAEAAGLIIKITSGEEVAARVERIYANPKPIIDEASALLRSVPE